MLYTYTYVRRFPVFTDISRYCQHLLNNDTGILNIQLIRTLYNFQCLNCKWIKIISSSWPTRIKTKNQSPLQHKSRIYQCVTYWRLAFPVNTKRLKTQNLPTRHNEVSQWRICWNSCISLLSRQSSLPSSYSLLSPLVCLQSQFNYNHQRYRHQPTDFCETRYEPGMPMNTSPSRCVVNFSNH